jgi:hypothetical protein
MAAKVFTVAELRDSHVSRAVRDAANYGPHGQGSFYVLAATKADAYARLRELRFPVREHHLRVVRDLRSSLAAQLAEPGDVITGDQTGGRRLVRVPAGTTAPIVLGTWRWTSDGRIVLDAAAPSKEGTK